jgi:hypothetical protein
MRNSCLVWGSQHHVRALRCQQTCHSQADALGAACEEDDVPGSCVLPPRRSCARFMIAQKSAKQRHLRSGR